MHANFLPQRSALRALRGSVAKRTRVLSFCLHKKTSGARLPYTGNDCGSRTTITVGGSRLGAQPDQNSRSKLNYGSLFAGLSLQASIQTQDLNIHEQTQAHLGTKALTIALAHWLRIRRYHFCLLHLADCISPRHSHNFTFLGLLRLQNCPASNNTALPVTWHTTGNP